MNPADAAQSSGTQACVETGSGLGGEYAVVWFSAERVICELPIGAFAPRRYRT
jgi:hypothetical protein